ncbi:acyl-CoA reductase [Paenibacillus sp. DXFW5]|uniref:Acyl-CoA reductase n=1 Tax=Paenibacillus rhizolycopersici TaxID=2780073 RepID=A0ABS2HCF2_9BACL|nr:acyl-CoA reductase [Paenibacillus rhizolycopersici]MBM6997249.1 acyl-CoA reductase [Paenibacillus rhizolycopersici]
MSRKFFFPYEHGEEVLKQLSDKSPLTPFHPVVLTFAQALSQRFVRMRQYPEIIALGFWMRKASMGAMQQQWKQDTTGRIMKARGTVFHIAPSNVDTIFIYSWILSLLAGNRNIIRLSNKEQAQQHILLQEIVSELAKPAYQELAERNVILTYEHNDAITAELSGMCHVRVIWGGDATVNTVRRIPLLPVASELVFPDRFSLSLMKAEACNELEQTAFVQLVQQFYNDAYWFDQLACSSPRLIVWHGDHEEVKRAQDRFWRTLEEVHRDKASELLPALQVQKLTTGLWLAADQEVTEMVNRPAYVRVMLDHVKADVRERHCGGGFFMEMIVEEISHLLPILNDKDQTLSYFGYNKVELMELAANISDRGIDRIVPIGKALDFQETWDGQSFLRSFTREIVII